MIADVVVLVVIFVYFCVFLLVVIIVYFYVFKLVEFCFLCMEFY